MDLPKFLHGVHDTDGVHLMDGYPGWVVITEAIGRDANDRNGRDYSEWSGRGLGVVVRLNHAHDGENGTIPLPEHYAAFAQRCANFVAASTGISAVVIANEPNLEGERPKVNGVRHAIKAKDYARCYQLCWAHIKRVRPDLRVLVAALAPWNNQSGDWLQYLNDIATLVKGQCDGFALHAYTHGSDPALVFSDHKEAQFGWRWHFRTYRDQLAVIEDVFGMAAASLFFGITEADQNEPWLDTNSGWVQNTYKEIANWNRESDMIIRFVAQYRSNRDDKWSFADKDGVKKDFRGAVEAGYSAPGLGALSSNTLITPVVHSSSAVSTPLPREVDPRAERRGTRIEGVEVNPGEPYWHVSKIFTANRQEATRMFGPDHHILANVIMDGQRRVDMPLLVTWGGGGPNERTTIYTKNNPGFAYTTDFSMSPGDFTLQVTDGTPSERVVGLKMGGFDAEGRWNPGEHESTLVEFTRVIKPAASTPSPTEPAPVPVPTPTPTPTAKRLVWPTDAPCTQRWGENPAYYQRVLGIPYHNGVDHAASMGTPLRAMADGEVMFVGSDPGYGLYIRMYHAAYGIHTFIAHLSEAFVNAGAIIKQGEIIGKSGASGNTAAVINADGSADTSRLAPHTHTEIRIGGRDAYAEGTYGHGNGRIDPEAAFYLINAIVGGVANPAPGSYAPIDPLVAEALWQVESSGAGFEDGELKIRFEAHIFERFFKNPALFARHFRYGANYLQAEYRMNESSPWVLYHNEGQSGEWGAFSVATMLNRTATLLSTSMGAPQIMGFHHADIGYNTPQQMFEAFSRSLAPQIMGFYQLCQHKKLAEPMRQHDWAEIVRRYNGVGFEAIYVPRLIAAYEALGGS